MSRESTRKQKEKKKKGIGTIIYRAVMIILVAIMAFSGYKIYSIYSGYKRAADAYEKIAKDVIAEEPEEDGGLKINWDALMARNADVIGWIYCEGTPINYPIVKGNDNDYYLHRTIDREWEYSGTIYADYRVENPFKDFNTVIYGHSMKDLSMLGYTRYYFSQSGFFAEHPVMQIYTPTMNYDLHLFAGMQVHETDMTVYQIVFSDEGDRSRYLQYALANNILLGYDGRVEVNENDKLVMLSTCSIWDEEKRFVIWGKLVPRVSIEDVKEAVNNG